MNEGSAQIVRAAEQLVGLDVPAGERRVTIEYLPVLRATLFCVGIATELAVFVCLAWLSLPRKVAEARLSSAAVGREVAK